MVTKVSKETTVSIFTVEVISYRVDSGSRFHRNSLGILLIKDDELGGHVVGIREIRIVYRNF